MKNACAATIAMQAFFCASGDEDKSVPPFAKTNLFSKKFAFAREFC
jgi:hypothetical protein